MRSGYFVKAVGKMTARRAGLSLQKAEARLGILLIAPALSVIAFVILYPLVSTLGLSFFSKDLLNPARGTYFIGLENYRWLLGSPDFYKALLHSLTLTLSSVLIQLMAGMIIALWLNMKFNWKGIIRGSFILPWAVPTMVAAFVWVWLLDAHYGVINLVLVRLGLMREGIPWLGLPSTAMVTVIIAHVWKGLPWVILVLLAGLQQIPEEMEEAARVDGASGWQQFWYVTLPTMRFVIAITVILRTIWTFNWFDFVYLLTGGGPARATQILPIEVYNTAFVSYRLGRASSIGAMMFLVLIAFTFLYFRELSREGEF